MALELKRILISDEVDAKCVEILAANGIDAAKKTKLSKEELMEEIKDYDGLIVRSATKVTKDVLNSGSRLKIVGRAGTGVDNVDIDAATRKGVIVMNTPGGNTISATEHTCALICALSRNVAAGDSSMKAGRWDRKLFMGHELAGKTLALVGLGQIGKQVALRMQAFGMRTIGFDPLVPKEAAAEFGVESFDLPQLWPQADYITVHVPLIPGKTSNLIDASVLGACKPGVRILNVARGGIIDEAALLAALHSGAVGGAGLDVFCSEPPTGVSAELVKHPKVIATPHLGASTIEAQKRVAVEIAQQFVDLAQGKALFGAVNAPAVANTLDPRSGPWIRLTQDLGRVLYSAAAPFPTDAVEITLTAFGAELEKARYLLNSALVGVLHAATPNGFNLVNAPLFAAEKNISAKFVYGGSAAPCCVDAAVELRVSAAGREFHVLGTASSTGAQLLRLNDAVFKSGAPLDGATVVFKTTPDAIPRVLTSVIGKGRALESLTASEASDEGSVWATLKVDGELEAGALEIH